MLPRLRLLAVLVMAFVAAGAMPMAASAASRVRSQWSFQTPGVSDCGAFVDNYTDYYDVVETDVFDSGGTLLLVQYHVEHHSDDTNSVTGLTLHEHGHFNEVDDYVGGTVTVTGNQEVANRAGAGVVVQDVGRQVYDIASGNLRFFAGGRKHSQILLGPDVWCAALG